MRTPVAMELITDIIVRIVSVFLRRNCLVDADGTRDNIFSSATLAVQVDRELSG